MSLRERYFGTPAEQSAESEVQREALRRRWAEQAEAIRSGWMLNQFKPWLESMLERTEPQPGAHEDMLYTAGTRNGLLQVKKLLQEMERQFKENENV